MTQRWKLLVKQDTEHNVYKKLVLKEQRYRWHNLG